MLAAKMIAPLVLVGCAFAAALPAAAQMGSMEHGADDHGSSATAGAPSTEAFKQAAQRMHAGMDIDYSGNADIDFVRGMIAHHQGAIEMAKVELEYGDDSEMRQLAENVIRDQQREIEQMEQWLEQHAAD